MVDFRAFAVKELIGTRKYVKILYNVPVM